MDFGFLFEPSSDEHFKQGMEKFLKSQLEKHLSGYEYSKISWEEFDVRMARKIMIEIGDYPGNVGDVLSRLSRVAEKLPTEEERKEYAFQVVKKVLLEEDI